MHTHTPNTLLGIIDKWMKNVLEDRAPYLLEEEREERNNMFKHYKPILTGLVTLTNQMQKLVSSCDKNNETVAADHRAEVEKMHAELPTLDENAEAFIAMFMDSEHLILLLMKKTRRHSQMS